MIVSFACWTLRHLSEGANYKIQAILDTGPLQSLSPFPSPVALTSTPCHTHLSIVTLSHSLINSYSVFLTHAHLNSLQTHLIIDSTTSLSHTFDTSNSSNTGITPRLVALLHPDNPLSAARRPALEAIGHFVSGSEKQTDKVLSCDGLPALLALYQAYEQQPCPIANNNDESNLVARRRILWTISNIVGGTSQQVNMITACLSQETNSRVSTLSYCLRNVYLISSYFLPPHHIYLHFIHIPPHVSFQQVQLVIDGGLLEKIVINLLNVKTYSDLQKEAVWAVMNATTDGNEKQAIQVSMHTLSTFL